MLNPKEDDANRVMASQAASDNGAMELWVEAVAKRMAAPIGLRKAVLLRGRGERNPPNARGTP